MIDEVIRVLLGEDCTKKVHPNLRSSYEHQVPALWSILGNTFGRESDPPSTRVVYTFSARPQSLRLGAERFLIYDQYLGQVMSQLTRLAVNEAPVSAVDAYLLKLVAQRFLVAGNALDTVKNGLHAASLRDSLAKTGFSIRDVRGSLVKRLTLTAAQECFIIAHELMHSFLNANPDVLEEMQGEYIEIIVPSFQDSISSVLQDSSHDLTYYSDYRRQFERRWGVEVSDEEHEAAVKDAMGSTPGASGSRVADLSDELATNIGQVEECICDLVGAFTTAAVMARSRIPLSMVLPAASLALHHLRLLQMIDQYVGGSWGKDLGAIGADPFAASLLRLSIFRFGATFTAGHLLGSDRPKLAQFIHRRLVKANLIHTEFVLDPFLFGIDDLLEKSRGIPLNEETAQEQLSWTISELL